MQLLSTKKEEVLAFISAFLAPKEVLSAKLKGCLRPCLLYIVMNKEVTMSGQLKPSGLKFSLISLALKRKPFFFVDSKFSLWYKSKGKLHNSENIIIS